MIRVRSSDLSCSSTINYVKCPSCHDVCNATCNYSDFNLRPIFRYICSWIMQPFLNYNIISQIAEIALGLILPIYTTYRYYTKWTHRTPIKHWFSHLMVIKLAADTEQDKRFRVNFGFINTKCILKKRFFTLHGHQLYPGLSGGVEL